ncbi:hypothetical protein K8I31_14370, partial [bacterium]|nr:hypothetical protein [bacterium]
TVHNHKALLIVTIEFRGNSQTKQAVKFNLNSNDFYEVIGRFGEMQTYKIECSFLSGRNVLRIREENPVYQDDGNGVFLRSIMIEPKK